jgi:4-amino-4-deoxy-L-arabinose transferase-like glycosyltransferase
MVTKRLYLLLYNAARWLGQQPWLLLLLWVAPLLVYNGSPQSLMTPEEGLYAHQGREMLTYQNWISLGWWGTPIFDRTPGLPWLIALSYHWFGVSEGAGRLPSLVAAAAAIALVGYLGRQLMPRSQGLWGAAIFATLPLWMRATRLATPEVLLVSLTLLALGALIRSEDYGEPRSAQRYGWGLVAGLALSLGLLVQGALVVLPLLALLPYLVCGHRRHRHLVNPGLYLGLVLGLIPLGVWLGYSVARYGWLPWQQLSESWRHQLLPGRLGPLGSGPHGLGAGWAAATAPPGLTDYLWHLPLMTLPWAGFGLVGVWLVGRNPSVGRRSLWLGYPVTLIVLLSLLRIPPGQGALLVYPFVGLLAAVGLHHLGRLFRSAVPGRYRVAVGLSWVAGVLGIVLMSAGVAMLITPGDLIPDDLRPYGWLAVFGGLGLLLPWLMALNRWGRVTAHQQWLWQWAWLLGPWLLAIAALTTGILGDYNTALAQAVRSPPVAVVLADNPVHFVQPSRDRIGVFLTVYTPHRGRPLSDWSQIPAEGYAWGNPSVVPFDLETYTVIATVEEWQLVRAPILAKAVPRG